MITANLSVIASGVYDFQCRVVDRYISSSSCSLTCNVQGGSVSEVATCKDRCRVEGEAISTVSVTIQTIDESAVWGAASIRLKGERPYWLVFCDIVLSVQLGLLL